MLSNPFELVTASKLSASDAIRLWCDDSRLDRVRGRESCFINGNRGTGKSMLFRILQYDCQKEMFPEQERAFISIYFPVRDFDFVIEEWEHFQNDTQRNTISECHLSLLVVKQLFLVLRQWKELVPEEKHSELVDLIQQRLDIAYQFSEEDQPTSSSTCFFEKIGDNIGIIDLECSRILNFVCRRLHDKEKVYGGPLFLFDTLLAPLADFFYEQLGVCIYILIDDGDDLPESHTIVLNTWIARRRNSVVFKVSTMYGYKSFETRSGAVIQQPHDFIQYDVATRYFDDQGEDYVKLIEEICKKRLAVAGISDSGINNIDPKDFFPEDEKQKHEMDLLRDELIEEYRNRFSGRAIRDNVYRHLSSEYMQRLNARRSLGSYSYSGLKTLAILSSGLVRDFIICAQRMFDNASRIDDFPGKIHIPPSIQNDIVRQHAYKILDEIGDPSQKKSRNAKDWKKIQNLIEGLGSLLKQKMMSKDSERRVFSFAFQTSPNEELIKILNMAISEGYLMRGYISKKEGTGRRTLYVLTRRLAPAFSLDVSSYSGYLSCAPEFIEELSVSGSKFQYHDPSEAQVDLFDGFEDAHFTVIDDNIEGW